MELMQEELKNKYNISNVFPVSSIILERVNIHLFYSKKERINYSIYTDGSLEHEDTWIDKRPGERDLFLENCGIVKRFDFLLEYANFMLIDKKYDNVVERNLYICNDINMIDENNIYQVLINEKENLKIKRLEK